MRAHVIIDGNVSNTIEVESLDFMPGLLDASIGGKIGDLWDGTVFSKAIVIRDVPAEKAASILQIDADTDSLIRSVIGERGSEYELAEREASAYKASGYPVTVPSSVSAWATAKGWTAKEAADSIIATATDWRSAQSTLRAERLLRKEQARTALDATALDAIKAQWEAFMVALKLQLNV